MSSATTTRSFPTNVTPLKTSRKVAQPRTDEQKRNQEEFVKIEMKHDEITQLRAEQKRIRDALREAQAVAKAQRAEERANRPDRLAAELARQAKPNQSLIWCMTSMLTRRVTAGQDRAIATDEVLAFCRTLLEQVDTSPKQPKVRAPKAKANN